MIYKAKAALTNQANSVAMADTINPQALLELLRAGEPEDKLNVDTSTIKYALYARKSTQGDEKQERSIPDQVNDCVDKVMMPRGIVPVQVIKEKFSAKEPGTRTKFMALISDIKAGKINGLIAWHPDRLARNMKDAGEIIDLLDKGVLRDLKFATSTFENNPTGKMLLGISFVLSKQYSEHLSESVIRGNRRWTEDAGEFIGKYKHGYYVDTNRHLVPDENSFTLVQNMFNMRLKGISQTTIREWINEQDYKLRKSGKYAQSFTWNKDDVSNLLRDPVYAGVLQYGQSKVNLTEKYDFTPMISVNDFLKINKIDSLDSSKIQSVIKVKGGEIRANLLRGLVLCGKCNDPLTSMIIDKRNKNKAIVGSYYYYKCENTQCAMYNKGARAKLVIDAAIEFFSTYLFVTKDNYAVYVENAKKALAHRSTEINSEIASLKVRISEKQQKYQQTKDLLITSPDLAEHYDLSSLSNEENSLRAQLADLVAIKNRSKESILSYEKYLKLLESTPVILNKIRDMEVMDSLLRIFFSNFTISPITNSTFKRSDVSFKLKEPWDGFLKYDKFALGAG